MADPLVTVEELAGWLRTPLAGEDVVWAALVLDAVSAFVRQEAGQAWDPVVDVPATARAVTLQVAARVYRNPHAASSWSKTRGPFGEQITFANPVAVGLYLTKDDKAALGIRGKSGLWTQATTRGETCGFTYYVPTEGGPPFPWYADDVVIDPV